MNVKYMVAAALLAASTTALAADMVMHRDPGCGCCMKWAAQVRAQLGSHVQVVDDSHRSALQRRLGVPVGLSGCHTAIIDGMVFEGHVPIADMKRVLAQRPKGVKGLVVAGMPIGSPGMEMAGMRPDAYVVVAFGPAGNRVYARHGK